MLRSFFKGFKAPFEAFEGFEKENEGGFEGFEGEEGFEALRLRLKGASLTLRRLRRLRSPLHLRELNEKFNEHFRALTGLHNASNNQMLKQSCNQLPDAITRSRIFCDHLSQCAMVVGVLRVLRKQRERAMYSNTVPWPMHLGQWPHSLRNHFI